MHRCEGLMAVVTWVANEVIMGSLELMRVDEKLSLLVAPVRKIACELLGCYAVDCTISPA